MNLKSNTVFSMKPLMKLYPRLRILLLLLSLLSATLYGQEWLGKILPIESSETDLSKFFDFPPTEKYGDTLFYKLKEGNLFINFSRGPCISGSWEAWNVGEGTIIALTFYAKKRHQPSFYKFTEEGTQKQYGQGYTFYTSDEKGLTYSAESGKVQDIIYNPPSRYENLRCKQ